ncbi:MAG: hypothetical protein WHU93_03370, partial [Arcobacteraceae bacterium]
MNNIQKDDKKVFRFVQIAKESLKNGESYPYNIYRKTDEKIFDLLLRKSEVFNKTEIAVLLSGKEDLIPGGNTAQYFRGDKTWQLLNTSAVPEGTNLYFTQERVRLSLSAQNPISFN